MPTEGGGNKHEVTVNRVNIRANKKASMWPNLLSLTRLILAPFLFIAIKNNDLLFLVLLIVIAIASDFLDGYLARRLNSITSAGKILDPLADKVCLAACAVSAALYGELPLVLLVVIILRDLVIAIGGISIIKTRHIIPVSNIWGKVSVNVLAVSLVVYIFKLRLLYEYAYWLIVIFVFISLASYFAVGLRYISYGKLNKIHY